MRKKKYGILNLETASRIRCCDPCYYHSNFNVDVMMPAGEYTCRIWIRKPPKEYPEDGERIGIIGMYKNDKIPDEKEMKAIGLIPVDAGLAGFFRNFPYQNDHDESWMKFCKRMEHKDVLLDKDFFISSSGYGDGCYTLKSHQDEDGNIDTLEIQFL